VIRSAKRLGLIAVQRVFMIDSLSKENIKNHLVDGCDKENERKSYIRLIMQFYVVFFLKIINFKKRGE